jgi:hypothetical protein
MGEGEEGLATSGTGKWFGTKTRQARGGCRGRARLYASLLHVSELSARTRSVQNVLKCSNITSRISQSHDLYSRLHIPANNSSRSREGRVDLLRDSGALDNRDVAVRGEGAERT